MIFEIPLNSTAEKFNIRLAGKEYKFKIRWNNDEDGGWILDISDVNDVVIVAGIPLVTGTDLLKGYEYLNFGGFLVLYSEFTDLPAGYNALGNAVRLGFVPYA